MPNPARIGRSIIKDGTTDETVKVTNGGLDINVQDQHTRALDLKFIKAEGPPTTLTAATAVDDMTIAVTSATGLSAGKSVAVFNTTGSFYFGQVISVASLVITLDTPLDGVFAIGSNVIAADHHLNVDGSTTTQVFQIGPVGSGTSVSVDITRIMGNITDAVAMDDGKFGGITALTNGCVLRHVNGTTQNIWNVKTNGDIALLCFDATYTDKAPAGENGYRFRNTYAGQGKHGVTIRLEPGDTLEMLIQDDLTDLTDFQMMAQGHVVE